jgi:HlyD family type I secretion membrane fusion protein
MSAPAVSSANEDLFSPRRELRKAVIALVGMITVSVPLLFGVRLPVAAIAPGKVVSEGLRKPVQHLEGGLVKAVLVREGEPVREGQVLMTLEDTRTQAGRESLRQRLIHLSAQTARLAAEEAREVRLTFAPSLVQAARDADASHLLEAQAELFAGRRRTLEERLSTLDSERGQLQQQVQALEGQARSINRQIELTREELGDYKRLFDQGYGLKVKMLELERRVEGLRGALAEADSDRAAAEARVRQIALERTRTLQEYVDVAAGRRAELRPEIAEIEQRLRVADDVRQREAVRAPIAGTVQGLKAYAPGSVIAPGETLLEIAPSRVDLIAEVHVDPADIETVRVGDAAYVRIFSRARNRNIELDGTVSMVSPDRFEDSATRRAYYVAHLVLDEAATQPEILKELRPGMPVEGHVVTGQRTPFSLLAAPLLDQLDRTVRQR